MPQTYVVDTLEELENLYGPVNPNSLAKETSILTSEYRRWIDRSPLFAIATSGPGGLDCSPRGDAGGNLFHILSDTALAFPDRRTNDHGRNP